MIELTDETFDDVVAGSDLPVLVDFTAAWCPPCRAMAPMLEELAVELADEMVVASLDVDRNPATTIRYGVMSMPTLVLFKGGEEQRRMVGARGKGRLLSELA
jgi:thioredoxin 1